MDGTDSSPEFIQEFGNAAGEDVHGPVLSRAYYGAHVGVAGIEHDTEIGMIDPSVHGEDFGRLVENEAGLEFPYHPDSVIGGNGCGVAPGARDAVERASVVAVLARARGRDSVHTEKGAADIGAEF